MSKKCGAKSIKQLIFSSDPIKVLENIKDSTEETKLVCVSSILAYLKHGTLKCKHPKIYEAWLQAYKQLEHEKSLRIKSNLPTPRQSHGLLDWENTVIPKRDSLPYGDMSHLLMCMYTYIPPRRQQDYADMLINEDDGKHNFIDLKSNPPFCCFREYKTAKSMGELRVEIPGDLLKVLHKSLKNCPRKYLFVKRDGLPYGPSFQKYSNMSLKKIFDDNQFVSVNSLRHSFASYLNSQRTLTLQQRENYAHQMGHSLMKNMEYVFL